MVSKMCGVNRAGRKREAGRAKAEGLPVQVGKPARRGQTLSGFLTVSFLSASCALVFSPRVTLAREETRPARIVSINLCADELLLRLADPGQIAAVTVYPKTDEAETVLKQNPAIRKIDGHAEEILGLHPDLVLTGPYAHRETVAFLKKRGVRILQVGLPKDFDDIYRNISMMAGAAGCPNRAQTVIRKMKEELAAYGNEGRGTKALFLQSEGYVPGRDTFENVVIRAAGLSNIAEAEGIREYGRLSLERIIELRPEVMIFTGDQKEKPSVRGGVLSHRAIRKAVPGARAVILPACLLNCGSPASVEAVKLLRGSVKT
jgi:iron complex transport system substrate-binding protein